MVYRTLDVRKDFFFDQKVYNVKLFLISNNLKLDKRNKKNN